MSRYFISMTTTLELSELEYQQLILRKKKERVAYVLNSCKSDINYGKITYKQIMYQETFDLPGLMPSLGK